MKNKKVLFIIMIILLTFITKVNALENQFNLDWTTQEATLTYNKEFLSDNSIVYGDGFVKFASNYKEGETQTSTNVYYYNKKGEVIKTITLVNSIVLDAVADAKYVYALSYQQDTGNSSIIKLDNNLATVATALVPVNFIQPNKLIYVTANKYGMSLMSIVDDRVNILGENILQYDLNLSSNTIVVASDALVQKYFLKISQLFKLSNNEKRKYVSADLNQNYIVYTGFDSCKSTWLEYFNNLNLLNVGESNVCKDSSYLVLSNRENKIEWEKEVTDYDSILSVDLIDEYIVTLATKGSSSYIVIYDLSGKVIQEIAKDNLYTKVNPLLNGFIINNSLENKNKCLLASNFVNPGLNNVDGGSSIASQENVCAVESSSEVYVLSYAINQNIEGKGTIEVAENVKAGEKVTFKAVPEKGYEIAAIRITDKDGKTIEQKDGTFVMPSSSVTIQVIFKEIVSNPNTADYGIFFLAGIAIIFGILMFITSKKLYFLR